MPLARHQQTESFCPPFCSLAYFCFSDGYIYDLLTIYSFHIDIITDDICYIGQYPTYRICNKYHKRRVKLWNLEDGKEPYNTKKAGTNQGRNCWGK